MKEVCVPKSTLTYLKDLGKNNNKPWFAANKDRYTQAHESMITLAEAIMEEMSMVDNIVPKSGKQTLYRIYRDVRFSKDKSPYKQHWAGNLVRATKLLRGGYYFHIEPGNTLVGGGFFSPNSADLKRIRKEIAADPEPLRAIMADPTFQKTFGSLVGNTVKTAPRGFDSEHPAIDLIRYKQFICKRDFTDKEVTSAGFVEEVVKTFQNLRPFFNYMSEILTTDENGVPLYEE